MKHIVFLFISILLVVGCGDPGNEASTDVADAELDAVFEADVTLDSNVDASMPSLDAAVANDAGLAACEPALALTASSTSVRSFDLIRVSPSGGTGLWTFELIENRSNGTINPETGVYLAGDVDGVTDVIEMRDLGCNGTATLELNVVLPMDVRPRTPEVRPGEIFTFEVGGGSGEFQFELLGESDSSLTESGVFIAGETFGQRDVQVTDIGTGQIELIQVTVSVNEGISPEHEQLFLAQGAVFTPGIFGGSGEYELIGESDVVSINGDQVSANETGEVTLIVQDRFLDRQTSLKMQVSPALTAPLSPTSDGTNSAFLKIIPDLNADGHRDVVMGHLEADVGAGNGGAVYVFLSETSGQLQSQPVQILSSSVREDSFGSSIEVADITGDGLDDLVVGARMSDLSGANSGGAFIYAGTGEPTVPFEIEPSIILAGINSFDFSGSAVSVCDFNGDGLDDIAVAATYYEDRTASPVQNSQGGILVYMGAPGGVELVPEIIVGKTLENGAFVNTNNLRLADHRASLTSGDFNGDGACDLAVGSWRYAYEGRNNSGLVQLYLGENADDERRGGLNTEPSLMWTEMRTQTIDRSQSGGQFGRSVQMGDINADGKADLLIAQHAGDVGGRDGGGAYVFLGRDVSGVATEYLAATTADWSFHGSNYDNLGYSIVIDDANDDGVQDLLIGSIYEDYPDKPNAGAVLAFFGQSGATPANEPDYVYEGVNRDGRIGEHFALKSDEDGDGLRDLVVYANRSTAGALHVGELQVIATAPLGEEEEREAQSLETTVTVSAQRFGMGIDYIGDVDGDGYTDALVAAPFSTHQDVSNRSGTAWLYFGREGGLEPTPVRLSAFPEYSAVDFLWSVAKAGDFNGDGIDDFAILLRSDERSASLNSENFNEPAGCPGRLGDAGGVYVFLGGTRESVGTSPAFAYWGGQGGVSPETLVFGGDVNGDGFDDLILGGHRWDQGGNDVGAIDVISGRARTDPDRIQVICFPLLRHIGNEAGGNLGLAATTLGDLNGDGCDDFAIGAQAEAAGGPTRQGIVWLFRGAGGPQCPNDFSVVRLQTNETQSRFGWSLDASDIDGDGISELMVGAFNRVADGSARGAAWFFKGNDLRNLSFVPLVEALSNQPATVNQDIAGQLLAGEFVNSEFGRAVAISGDVIAVGSPSSTVSDITPVGLVHLYRFDPASERLIEFGLMVGEVARPGGRLGERLSGHPETTGRFLVNGSWGNASGLDNGSVYELSVQSL